MPPSDAIAIAVPAADPARCRALLDDLYARYHHPRYLGSDPLAFVYRFDAPADREIVALLAALLAYGNVKAIRRGIEAALERMDRTPARFLDTRAPRHIRARFADWRYRVTAGTTLAGLLIAVRRLRRTHGSLGALFHTLQTPADDDIIEPAGRLVAALRDAADVPLDHLLPDPRRGSACKRLMLLLRWMLRRDAIDPGLWVHASSHATPTPTPPPAAARLIAPVDTHLHAVARQLGWTPRRQADLMTARQITAALKAVCPHDPLRYDFALTRPGILRDAMPRFDRTAANRAGHAGTEGVR